MLNKSQNLLSLCHLGVQLDLCIFEISGSNSTFSEMGFFHGHNELDCASFCLRTSDHFTLVSAFHYLPCKQFFKLIPFLVHCCFSIREFHCLTHRDKLVHQIVVTGTVETFFPDVIFMMFWWSRIQTFPPGFMDLHGAYLDLRLSESLQVSPC